VWGGNACERECVCCVYVKERERKQKEGYMDVPFWIGATNDVRLSTSLSSLCLYKRHAIRSLTCENPETEATKRAKRGSFMVWRLLEMDWMQRWLQYLLPSTKSERWRDWSVRPADLLSVFQSRRQSRECNRFL